MLSRRHRSLCVGRQSPVESTAEDPPALLALPPHPQALAHGIRPVILQHQVQVQIQAQAQGRLRLRVPTASPTTTSSAPTLLPRLPSTETTREHALLCAKNHPFQRETEEKGWRSIMHHGIGLNPAPTHSPSPSPSSQTVLPLRLHQQSSSTFTFQLSPKPAMILTFNPRPSPPRPRKRCRAVADVDGEHSSMHKKKRRLRLFLITSRLSPEFSSPATNIVDRGNSKIAVWAKQKAMGRNLLRKAAILNRIKRRDYFARETHQGLGRSLVEQEREQKQLELAGLAFVYGSHDTHARPTVGRTTSFPPSTHIQIGGYLDSLIRPSPTSSSPNFKPSSSSTNTPSETAYQSPNDAYAYPYTPTKAQVPRRAHLPLPPSPLGISNYDAFDQEDAFPNPYAHFDDDDDDDEDTDLFGSSMDTETGAAEGSTIQNPSIPASNKVSTGTAKTPPQSIYSDFSKLDPGEPIVGDFDQVEEGADPVWPIPLPAQPASPSSVDPDISTNNVSQSQSPSCSPNFAALFATPDRGGPASVMSGQPLYDKLDERAKRERAMEEERLRQRKLMFPQFHPAR